jgi:hypothetical protein
MSERGHNMGFSYQQNSPTTSISSFVPTVHDMPKTVIIGNENLSQCHSAQVFSQASEMKVNL